MLRKRKPTKINIDISRVMKQLQSWFTQVSPHFVACLHLQRREQAGDAGVGRQRSRSISRGGFCSISSTLREAWVVWLLNTFRHGKLDGLPQILKKTRLQSEAPAVHSFHIQSTFSSLLKIPCPGTPRAWLVVVIAESWHCPYWNLHLFENASVAKVERMALGECKPPALQYQVLRVLRW